MTSLKATLFDYDGVLADTLADMLRLAAESCAELGCPRNPVPADLDALETMSYVDYGRQLGLPADQVQAFARLTMARFEARDEPPALFAGMDAVLRQAAAEGQVGIVTASSARAVQRFLEAHQLKPHIDALVSVEHPGTRAEKILAALSLLGREPQEACLIGDAVSDVRACREVGVRSVAVGWGHQRPERLAAAGAAHVVHSPRELAELLQRL